MKSVVSCLIVLITTVSCWSSESFSRRAFVQAGATATVSTILSAPLPALSVDKTTTLIDELKQSKERLQPIPELLEQKEWDKVRSILKLPPVNKLWNLGDSQNTVLQLAKETGDVDLFELKEDLAYNLQMCDQLTYDNAFVYFQPGNGKFKIKEPIELAQRSMKQIQQVIDLATE